MAQKTQAQLEQEDGFIRGNYDLPFDHELRAMSYLELAESLHGSAVGGPKYLVVEREMKLRLVEDQARINRKSVYIGGIVAGVFGLSGVFLGWWLRDSSSMQQPTPSSSVGQVQQGKFGVQPSFTNVSPAQPVASKPVPVLAPVQGDSGASKKSP